MGDLAHTRRALPLPVANCFTVIHAWPPMMSVDPVGIDSDGAGSACKRASISPTISSTPWNDARVDPGGDQAVEHTGLISLYVEVESHRRLLASRHIRR